MNNLQLILEIVKYCCTVILTIGGVIFVLLKLFSSAKISKIKKVEASNSNISTLEEKIMLVIEKYTQNKINATEFEKELTAIMNSDAFKKLKKEEKNNVYTFIIGKTTLMQEKELTKKMSMYDME